MPRVRLGVRNEFGLGKLEFCKGASGKKKEKEEEPKAVLDGVAVAGLVGILRQLGDLADFAATVFDDLHERITATRTRGRKVMTRVRNIEAALPSVEKALKAQQRHVHFAYVAGSDWHASLQVEQNLLQSSELPQFMMDSYEECRGPPHLYLLDKFDHAGNGACLRRYSDPSYFKRMWDASQTENTENLRVDKKHQKIKRKESQKRNGGAQHAGYGWHDSGSSIFASSSVGEKRVFIESVSSPDIKLNTEFSSRATSFGSNSKVPLVVTASVLDVDDEPGADSMDDVSQHEFLHEESIPRSFSITWDEKIEIIKPTSPASYDDIHVDRVQDPQDVIRDQDSQSQPMEVDSEPECIDHGTVEVPNEADILFHIGEVSRPLPGVNHFDEVTSEADNYVDALTTLDSETETEAECFTKREVKSLPSFSSQGRESQTGTVPVVTVENPDFCAAEESQELHLSSSAGLEHVQSPCVMEFLQNQELSAVNAHDVSESKNDDEEEFKRSGNSSSPPMKIIKCTGEVSMVKNPPTSDMTGAPTIQLWSNGSLFGVEPSKPPELVVNIQSQKPVSGSKKISSDFSSCTIKSQMIADELNVESDAISLKNESTSVGFNHELKVNGEHNNLSYSVHGNSTNGHVYARGHSAVRGSEGSASGNDNQWDNDAKQEGKSPEEASISNSVGYHEVGTTRNSVSSGFSELAQRFLANSLQSKVAISTHSRSSIAKSEETSPFHSNEVSNGAELHAYCEAHINKNVTHISPKSPLLSASHYPEQSSPPLEYMKISSHPMNGLENSNLKLELCSGGLRENSEDSIYPSFQLLQGRVEPNVCSESDDDDTFCRSCPYSSDDIPSPRSYSNSEQWEEDEKSECIDPEINDADHRSQSPSTPISRSMQFEQVSHLRMGAPSVLGELGGQDSQVIFQAKSMEDLPGLESVLLENQQKEIFHFSPATQANVEVPSKVELPPPPPPLPPVQWTTKPLTTSKDNDAEFSSSSIDRSRGEEQPSPKPPPVAAVISPDSNEKKYGQKLNLKKRTNLSVVHKETDTREDLLHQIRNQAFNLRRTARPAQGDVPKSTKNVANGNVAAILEKASAIRQAFVGSDDGGDDDSWE